MARHGSTFLLLGILFCVNGTTSRTPLATLAFAQNIAQIENSRAKTNPQSDDSRAPHGTPIIKLNGLCAKSAGNTGNGNCQIVITQVEFERIVNALQPGMSRRAQHEFALQYAEDLALAGKAAQLGLDKGPKFEEQVRVARVKILAQAMKKAVREKASQIPEKKIEDYYHNNTGRFEEAEIDRIYIPRVQQQQTTSETGQSVIDGQKRLQEYEEKLRDEAESLRKRALAGEDFADLQVEAYRAGGIKGAVPTTSMRIRRISLPSNQTAVMDMKPGEISQVFSDPNGLYIYRLRTKKTLPLDQVRDEIKETVRSLDIEEEMSAILHSASPTIDETYFAR